LPKAEAKGYQPKEDSPRERYTADEWKELHENRQHIALDSQVTQKIREA